MSLTIAPSIAESVLSAEITDALATFAKILLEAGTAVDLSSAIATILDGVLESGTAADTPSELAVLPSSTTEALSAADTNSNTAQLPSTVGESGGALDGSSNTAILPSTLTETANAVDTVSLGSIVGAAASESASAGDTPTATATLLSTTTEAVSAADIGTNTAQRPTTVGESGAALDSSSSSAILLAALIEALSGADTASLGSNYNTGTSENLGAGDTAAATANLLATIAESGSAGDTLGAALAIAANIAESGSAADLVSSLAVYVATLIESGVAAETITSLTLLQLTVGENAAALDLASAVITGLILYLGSPGALLTPPDRDRLLVSEGRLRLLNPATRRRTLPIGAGTVTPPAPPSSVYSASVAEAGFSVDATTSVATHLATVAEFGSAVDAPASPITYPTTAAEAGSAVDAPAGVTALPAAIAESGAAADVPSNLASHPATVAESGVAADTISSIATLPSTVAEIGSALDTPSSNPQLSLQVIVPGHTTAYTTTAFTHDPSAPDFVMYYSAVADGAMPVTASAAVPFRAAAPGHKKVTVSIHNTVIGTYTPDIDGNVSGTLDLSAELNGPLVLDVYAYNQPDNTWTVESKQRLNLFITGGADYVAPFPTGASGMALVFADDFAGPLSVSATDTTKTWFPSKPDGAGSSQFGDADFQDPDATGPHNPNPFHQQGSFLRIRCSYDPLSVGRPWTTGFLSGGRPSAIGGRYFDPPFYAECRFLSPIGETPWPAFWALTKHALVTNDSNIEIDVVENLGRFPANFRSGGWLYPVSPGSPIQRLPAGSEPGTFSTDPLGFEFHTYGVRVDANTTFFVDGVQVSQYVTDTLPSGPTSFFVMIDLALGAGWANAVPPAGYYDMWIDYVRVYQRAPMLLLL